MRIFIFSLLTVLILGGCSTDYSDDKNPVITLNTVAGTGNLYISGRVVIPLNIPANREVRLQVEGPFTESSAGIMTDDSHYVYYRINNLDPSQDYFVSVDVDETDNGTFGEAGDYAGYYDGLPGTPIQNVGAATAVHLDTASREGIDFGIGIIP